MPKMKTHRGAAKRFRLTGSGKVRRQRAYHSHLLAHKGPGRKRRLGQTTLVDAKESARVLRMLPYGN